MSALSLDCRQRVGTVSALSLVNSKVSIHRINDSVKVEETHRCSDLVSVLPCLSPNKTGNTERGALTVTLTALGGMPVLFKFTAATATINNTYSVL